MSKIKFEDFDQHINAVNRDKDARLAAEENQMRRDLAAHFEALRRERGLSIRALAEEIGSSVSQVQRLLHKEVGGSLTLRTLVRACDALDARLSVQVRSVPTQSVVIPLGGLISQRQWATSELGDCVLKTPKPPCFGPAPAGQRPGMWMVNNNIEDSGCAARNGL